MYKVMLVDDERVILEGISQVVDWAAAGTELVGTARNGVEALDKIGRSQPDIVITDISMPGLDGLGLIEKAAEEYPGVRFIMLSGYKEFEYARKAMQFGVKHYLLKPCNENQIHDALTELLQEHQDARAKEHVAGQMEQRLQRVLPHVKEQFLLEFMTNRTYGPVDLEYYQELFNLKLEDQQVRLLLFRIVDEHDYSHLFAIKNIASDLLPHAQLSTTIEGKLLLLLKDSEGLEALKDSIEEVRAAFKRLYKLEVTAALSGADRMIESRRLFREALQCLNHRFFLGEGKLITTDDLHLAGEGDGLHVEQDADRLCQLIKSGHTEEVQAEVERLFELLAGRQLEIGVTRSYVLQLYSAMIHVCPPEEAAEFTQRMASLPEVDTLSGLKGFVAESAARLTNGYYKNHICRQSSAVEKMMDIVDRHFGEADLSLNGVAHQMLYMNPDYLGKIFKKVTGENFSNYVNRLRIERACDHIRRGGDVKVFELAELFGFGGNSQYFSQVFKKWTGMTPTEFRRTCI
ncbi:MULTISPECIES: response regulator [Paenibacillus]|uniref:response regulator n=1 Tax=Paenibacillus TaxID=44249 RepID=UPI0030DC0340